MKNLLLALAISLGIVACGDESVGGPDVIDLDTDRDVSDVDIENPDVDVVEDTDADADVVEDVVDTDSEGSDVVACPDLDDDGVCDDDDNCIDVVNEDQTDSDSDGIGDACETCETFEVELVNVESLGLSQAKIDIGDADPADVVCVSTDSCPVRRVEDLEMNQIIYRNDRRTECTITCTLDGAECLGL